MIASSNLPVDADPFAVHKSAGRSAKPVDHLGNVLGVRGALCRGVGTHRVKQIVGPGRHSGLDKTRANNIRGDPLGSQLGASGLGHPDNGVFRSVVSVGPRREQAGDAGDVPPPSGLSAADLTRYGV